MSKHLLLASTSTLHQQAYLSYLTEDIERFFGGKEHIVFIPFAQPSGISLDDYTAKAAEVLAAMGKTVKGLHTWKNPIEGIEWADGFFTGGGNTFLLLKTLQEKNLINPLREAVLSGKPYMGTSAGSNIAGQTINTTNDMPIVYPNSFIALGFVPFNLNPHYLDPNPDSSHMGETRETRINEFHVQSKLPVVGLREGSTLEIHDDATTLLGEHTARIFKSGESPLETKDVTVLNRLMRD